MNRQFPNSTKELNQYIVENPYRADIAVKALQAAYSENLDWLEKSFPRAVLRTEKITQADREVERRFPAVRTMDGNDEADMLEVDNYAAYDFFYQIDTENLIDFEERVFNVYQAQLRNIFWFNLNEIDPNRGDDFLPELETEILQVISNTKYQDFNGTTIRGIEVQRVYQEPQNIFSGFSFNLVDTQFLHYPYRGLRFDLLVTFSEQCQ